MPTDAPEPGQVAAGPLQDTLDHLWEIVKDLLGGDDEEEEEDPAEETDPESGG